MNHESETTAQYFIEFSPDGFPPANHRQTLNDAGNLIKELKETIYKQENIYL